MRKVCRKGRPAPAQTAGSHQSEKTELLVWHLPHTQPFSWLSFSVRKLETPSGGEDLLIAGALRKLRSLLLPKEQNTDYLQNELVPNKESLCRCLTASWLAYIFWCRILSNLLSKCISKLCLYFQCPSQNLWASTGHSENKTRNHPFL